MESYYIRLAKEMLNVDALPIELRDKLHMANNMLKKVNAELTSRQAVLNIIMLWELEQVLIDD